jgi:hypothetical protein
MKMVVNIVNRIRGGNKAQIHRAFSTFLEEMDANCGDILLHFDIKWSSPGKCLQRLCAKKRSFSVSSN